jgi:ZIP family zinc transporter
LWRAPGLNLQSAVMHFAAGIVFAVVAMEFLPDLIHEKSVVAAGVGFAVGTAAMLGIRSFTRNPVAREKEIERGAEAASSGLLFGTGVDIAIDGLMLGIGFAAGAKEGSLLALALTFELVALGLATVVALNPSRAERRRAALIVGGLALLFVVSAGLGNLVLQLVTGPALAGVLAFGSAALLFLVTEELLTEAHEVTENPWLTSTFFVGFLLIMILELLA